MTEAELEGRVRKVRPSCPDVVTAVPPRVLSRVVLRPIAVLGVLIASAATSTPAEAAGYYVDARVESSGDGQSPSSAFKTIGQCARIRDASTICRIVPGTYREKIDVGASGVPGQPMSFIAEPGGAVVVSAAERIPDTWLPVTVFGRALSKVQLSAEWNLGEGKNQVFCDGRPMTEARWPNVSDPWQVRRSSFAISTSGTLEGSVESRHTGTYAHPGIEAYWAGGHMNMAVGQEWSGMTGTVTAASAGSLTFEYTSDPGFLANATPTADDPFMLWGKLEALDTVNEWFFDTAGDYGPAYTLYAWLPDNEPSAHVLEMSRRETAFAAANKSDVRVQGLSFFAGRVTLGADTQRFTFDRVLVEYAGRNLLSNWGTAVRLDGQGHELVSSTIRFSPSVAIYVSGSGHRIENNVIHNTGYAFASSGIYTTAAAPATDTTIAQNTLFEATSTAVSFTGLKHGVVSHNHFYNATTQISDVAAINCWNGGDGQGTSIEYNVVHDSLAYYNPVGGHNGGHGIRIDSGAAPLGNSNFVIHHNIVFNTSSGVALSVWGLQETMLNYGNANNKVVANTCAGRVNVNLNNGSLATTTIANNLFDVPCLFCSPVPAGVNVARNFFASNAPEDNFSSNPLLSGVYSHDYSLRAGSPAIDTGQVIAPLTDGYRGTAPDIGALESGAPPFVAGALLLEEHLSGLTSSCTAKGATTRCEVRGLPIGRGVPTEFRIRVGELQSGPCANGYVTTTDTPFAVCELEASLATGTYPLAATLDGTSFHPCEAAASVQPPPTVCDARAWMTPVGAPTQSSRALSGSPLMLEVDTARLIADGTLDPACARLRVRPYDLSRDFGVFVETATCGTERTLVWARDPLGGPIAGPSEPYAQLYVAHGDPTAASVSDLHVAFDAAPLLWLSARDPRLVNGQPVDSWLDTYGTKAHAAVQTNPTKQPTFSAAGPFPSVMFDGVDDALSVPTFPATGIVTIVVVYWTEDSGLSIWPRLISSAAAGHTDDGQGYALLPALNADDHKAQVRPQGNAVSRRRSATTAYELANFTIGSHYKGASDYFKGGIAEVVVFDSYLSNLSLTKVTDYFDRVYGLSSPYAPAPLIYDDTKGPCVTGADAGVAQDASVEGVAQDGGIEATPDSGSQSGQAVVAKGCGCTALGGDPSASVLVATLVGLRVRRRRAGAAFHGGKSG